jgi:hypothetical protein
MAGDAGTAAAVDVRHYAVDQLLVVEHPVDLADHPDPRHRQGHEDRLRVAVEQLVYVHARRRRYIGYVGGEFADQRGAHRPAAGHLGDRQKGFLDFFDIGEGDLARRVALPTGPVEGRRLFGLPHLDDDLRLIDVDVEQVQPLRVVDVELPVRAVQRVPKLLAQRLVGARHHFLYKLFWH